MNIALAEGGAEAEDETTEDIINRIMEGRKMLANASYFAFTATPKNKTLKIFGEPWPDGAKVKHRPFHSYTMKQAIQEGFILDVLKTYTPVASYYRLMKKVEDDPEFDARRATKKLRRYVESHEHAIRQKAEIMIDHFHTFVLDFMNDSDVIAAAFADYYRTTVLSEETDPNKLHDLQATIMSYGVYTQADVDRLVERYLGGASRDQLDPILDACVAIYIGDLDEDGQVDFKGRAKAFVRTYEFLASILPYSYAEWEKLSIFLNFLIPKLPAPKEEDLSKGILESINMDSYRVKVRSAMQIALADQDAMIYPVPTAGGSRITVGAGEA